MAPRHFGLGDIHFQGISPLHLEDPAEDGLIRQAAFPAVKKESPTISYTGEGDRLLFIPFESRLSLDI